MRFRLSRSLCRFQHTATRRRLGRRQLPLRPAQGFNTQPPEGGWEDGSYRFDRLKVSIHSRPKAAGKTAATASTGSRFQHTAARRQLGQLQQADTAENWFQHTAARRRLGITSDKFDQPSPFQHTAARRRLAPARTHRLKRLSFNTQPPEGGWLFQS